MSRLPFVACRCRGVVGVVNLYAYGKGRAPSSWWCVYVLLLCCTAFAACAGDGAVVALCGFPLCTLFWEVGAVWGDLGTCWVCVPACYPQRLLVSRLGHMCSNSRLRSQQ
jgi:hypothetical protein